MASSHEGKMSLDQIKELSAVNSELAHHLAQNPNPKLPLATPWADITAARRLTAQNTQTNLRNLGPPHRSIAQHEIQIPVRDGWTSRSIVCRPSSPQAPVPLIVIYHGGGFWTSNPEGMLNYARRLSSLLGVVIVCPSYRLAPEHPFPIGVNDAWDVLVWLSTNASSDMQFNADLSQGFIIGGSSAGANFAGVLARRAVEEGLKSPLTGQWLSFPTFGNAGVEGVGEITLIPEAERYNHIWGTSWTENKDAMIVPANYMARMLEWYQADFASPLYNPLTASPPFEVVRMPKAYLQVAGGDLLRDDGIVYAYALEDAGIDVRLEAYKGLPHTFPFFLPKLEVSRRAMVDTAMGFAWLLDMEIHEEIAEVSMLGDSQVAEKAA